MGLIFDRSFERIQENRQRRIVGLDNCIPFKFEKLSDYLPGVQRKNYTIVTANSGVGKTKFAKKLYVIDVINYIEQNPETDMKIDLKYFCLEENKETFITSIISYKLYLDHGLRYSIKEIESIQKQVIIDEDVLQKIAEMREWFVFFERHVEIIDDIRNPYGIFNHIQDFMLNNGHWVMTDVTYTDRKQNPPVERVVKIHDHFVHNHPQHYVIVVIDHISLVQPEKGMTGKHEAIGKLSSDYLVKLRNHYWCTIVVVQQQSSDKEKQQYTNRGASIEAKLEPSLDGLGDNKMTQRDADEVLGLFAPDRYEITNHRGYDIQNLKDNFRSGIINKSRYGSPNIRIGFLFDGAVGEFRELKRAPLMSEEDYEEALQSCGRSLNEERTWNFS